MRWVRCMFVCRYGLGRDSGWVRFNEGGSGNVWSGIVVLIWVDTPFEKVPICSCMYIKKVSLDQRPNFLMVSQAMPFNFMAMAPPARSE